MLASRGRIISRHNFARRGFAHRAVSNQMLGVSISITTYSTEAFLRRRRSPVRMEWSPLLYP
jgi:hypothetical protein